MRKLIIYPGATIDFFDEVLEAKNRTLADPTYKDRITAMRPNIVNIYNNYDVSYAAGTLPGTVAFGYVVPNKTDLLSLYKYKNKPFQTLKTTLTTTAANRIVNTCQNCTINEINSFDHFLPKDDFPEFAINAKNLFPSCTQCNGYKSVMWQQHGNFLFLNLYCDNIPLQQYLFVDVVVNDSVDAIFTVENRYGIDAAEFALINSHYTRLRLPERFRLNRDNTVSELVNTVKAMAGQLNEQQTKDVVIDKCERDKLVFGSNHWKTILAQELINSPDFYDFALNY